MGEKGRKKGKWRKNGGRNREIEVKMVGIGGKGGNGGGKWGKKGKKCRKR